MCHMDNSLQEDLSFGYKIRGFSKIISIFSCHQSNDFILQISYSGKHLFSGYEMWGFQRKKKNRLPIIIFITVTIFYCDIDISCKVLPHICRFVVSTSNSMASNIELSSNLLEYILVYFS
jgi:hypothetical protein